MPSDGTRNMAKASQKAPYEQWMVQPRVLPTRNSMMPAMNCAAPPKKTARPKTAWSGPTLPRGFSLGSLCIMLVTDGQRICKRKERGVSIPSTALIETKHKGREGEANETERARVGNL